MLDDLLPLRDQVVALSSAVELLYQNMDASLQFKLPASEIVSPPGTPAEKTKADLVKDFRGVACPLNFVKTKMALSQLSKGQVLDISLDDGAPIENVPRSVADEGHVIIEQKREHDYWVVRIRKGT